MVGDPCWLSRRAWSGCRYQSRKRQTDGDGEGETGRGSSFHPGPGRGGSAGEGLAEGPSPWFRRCLSLKLEARPDSPGRLSVSARVTQVCFAGPHLGESRGRPTREAGHWVIGGGVLSGTRALCGPERSPSSTDTEAGSGHVLLALLPAVQTTPVPVPLRASPGPPLLPGSPGPPDPSRGRAALPALGSPAVRGRREELLESPRPAPGPAPSRPSPPSLSQTLPPRNPRPAQWPESPQERPRQAPARPGPADPRPPCGDRL